jgi:FMN reductase
MSLVVTISGSPSAGSRTQALAAHAGAAIAGRGFEVAEINVRDLPPDALIYGRTDAEPIRRALGLIERASGVIVSTPVYKASYTGVLKAFLDLLPQFGLNGKVVLPLVTGGTVSHVLAIDYALRPVLHALGAQHVVAGLFILDKLLELRPDGTLTVAPEISGRLAGVLDDFVGSLSRRAGASAAREAAGGEVAAPSVTA